MNYYFSNDPMGDGLLFHDTEGEARVAAERALELAHDDEWAEDTSLICWGEVIGKATKCCRYELRGKGHE